MSVATPSQLLSLRYMLARKLDDPASLTITRRLRLIEEQPSQEVVDVGLLQPKLTSLRNAACLLGQSQRLLPLPFRQSQLRSLQQEGRIQFYEVRPAAPDESLGKMPLRFP